MRSLILRLVGVLAAAAAASACSLIVDVGDLVRDDGGREDADTALDGDIDVRRDADADGGEDLAADAETDGATDADADGVEDGTLADVDSEVDGDAATCPEGMVLIPAGPFIMGSDPGEGDPDQQPEHRVDLSAYCIDVTEVTWESYLGCVDAGGCVPAACSRFTDDHPVACVTWDQAVSFCAWAGRRLPTEAEWEKAARGGCEIIAPETCGPEDERTYPWGDTDPNCVLCNFSSGCTPGTDLVGTHASGDSSYGLHDMAGNVAEWVSDWYGETYYETCAAGCTDPQGPSIGTYRIWRGGSFWAGGYFEVATSYRRELLSTTDSDSLGLRCAASI